MEIIIKGFIVNSQTDIEEHNIRVNDLTYPLIKGRLEYEYSHIVTLLKELKLQGFIKSIYIPKNKKIQKELDKLTTTKRQIKYSIQKIKAVFG